MRRGAPAIPGQQLSRLKQRQGELLKHNGKTIRISFNKLLKKRR